MPIAVTKKKEETEKKKMEELQEKDKKNKKRKEDVGNEVGIKKSILVEKEPQARIKSLPRRRCLRRR